MTTSLVKRKESDNSTHCRTFVFRQVEAQERLQQIVNMQLDAIKMRDEIQQIMSACKHQQYLPDTAKKCQELIIQILEYTQKTVQVKKTWQILIYIEDMLFNYQVSSKMFQSSNGLIGDST